MDDDLRIVNRIGQYTSICVSALALATLEDSEADHLGEDGYFIYEVDERPLVGGIHVLAKVASYEAALRIAELWQDR